MANIKSQIKRNRQNEKRRLRNRNYRGSARTAVKDARVSLESGKDTKAAVMAAISALDIAAQKGAIHPRNAARRKGRLMKRLTAAKPAAAESTAEETKAESKKPAEKKPTDKKSAAKK